MASVIHCVLKCESDGAITRERFEAFEASLQVEHNTASILTRTEPHSCAARSSRGFILLSLTEVQYLPEQGARLGLEDQ